MVFGWLVLIYLLVLYIGVAVESTWAADYLTRSGRGLFARLVCYVELFPAAVLLLLWCLMVVAMLIIMSSGNATGGPTWAQLFVPLALLAILVALAHAGVIRRWHPALRIANYLL